MKEVQVWEGDGVSLEELERRNALARIDVNRVFDHIKRTVQWTPEAAADMMKMHGTDIEEMLTKSIQEPLTITNAMTIADLRSISKLVGLP